MYAEFSTIMCCFTSLIARLLQVQTRYSSSVEVLFLLATFPVSSNTGVTTFGDGTTDLCLNVTYFDSRTGCFSRAAWSCFHGVWSYRVVFPKHLLSTCCYGYMIRSPMSSSLPFWYATCNTGGGMKTREWDQYYACTNTCMSVVILRQYTSSHSVSS